VRKRDIFTIQIYTMLRRYYTINKVFLDDPECNVEIYEMLTDRPSL